MELVTYPIVNWILLCIADALEQRRFPGICPTDNEDAEVGVFGWEFRSLFQCHCVLASALRSKNEDLQSIDKCFESFGSLVSHIDAGRRQRGPLKGL